MCEISTILHSLPKKHGLSLEYLADCLGVPFGTLSRYLNPNDPLPFPLRLLIPFMRACNNDLSPLDMIESRVSRVAIAMAGESEPVTMTTAANIAEQQGKALSTLITALADNHLDDDEKRQLRHQYCDLAKMIHTAVQELNK